MCLGASLCLFVFVMLGAAARGAGYDLVPLIAAGRLVSTDRAAHLYAQDPQFYNLVGDSAFREASASSGFVGEPTPFVYPPLVAVIMQPIAGIPFSTLARIWAVLSIALLLGGLHLTLQAYVPEWQRPSIWSLALLALCWFEPLLYGLWLGQTTAIIFPLVMGAVVLQRRRPAAAGFALAIAAFVKLTPVVLAGVWLWRGPRRVVWWFVGWMAALWIVSLATAGIGLHAAYLARVGAIGRHLVVAYNNHSLLAFLSRPALEPSAWLNWRIYEPRQAIVATSMVLLAGGALAAYLVLRRAPAGESVRSRQFAEAFAFLFILLAPGVTWTHYFVFLLPTMVIALRFAPSRSIMPAIVVGSAFLLCSRPLLSPQDVPSVAGGALRVGAPTLAAAMLGITLVWIAHRSAMSQSARDAVVAGRS